MSEADIIKGAREFLDDPSNWVKGAWCEHDAACLEGALARAAGLPMKSWSRLDPGEYAQVHAAAQLVLAHLPTPENGNSWVWLSVFNDEPTTTHEDVLNVLDKTLADLGELA